VVSLTLTLTLTLTHLDVQHAYVYPQPPFPAKNTEGLRYMSNPCSFIVNGVGVGLTSADILKHIGAEETCRYPIPNPNPIPNPYILP
jgi:hypothetical protein